MNKLNNPSNKESPLGTGKNLMFYGVTLSVAMVLASCSEKAGTMKEQEPTVAQAMIVNRLSNLSYMLEQSLVDTKDVQDFKQKNGGVTFSVETSKGGKMEVVYLYPDKNNSNASQGILKVYHAGKSTPTVEYRNTSQEFKMNTQEELREVGDMLGEIEKKLIF